jgi:hypothetical protein
MVSFTYRSVDNPANLSYSFVEGGCQSEPYKYPVCPSFAEWAFPHDRFPSEWETQAIRREPSARMAPSGFTERVLSHDKSCIITGHETSVQACHLCPRSEADWFWRNDMDRYNLDNIRRSDYALDDVANGLILRSDLHQELDAHGFVLMRKSECGYVVHCLTATPDILPAYHNRQTRSITTAVPQFVYARLAYAILPLLSAFLSRGESTKRVIRLKVGGTSSETETLDISTQEFRKPPSKSRSASPKKRSRPGSIIEDHDTISGCPSTPTSPIDLWIKRQRRGDYTPPSDKSTVSEETVSYRWEGLRIENQN